MSDLYTVEVVIPIPLSQTFDYMVSKLEFENIKKGSRVIVSFGHKKLYTAIVVKKFINKQYDFNLKDIEFIVDDSPCLSTETNLVPMPWKILPKIAEIFIQKLKQNKCANKGLIHQEAS